MKREGSEIRLLAFDLGTTNCKAAAYANGASIARASRSIATRHPGPGLAEQESEVAIQALFSAGMEAVQRAGWTSVDAIGITGQSDSLVAVDARGQPLGPAVLWMDQRGTEEATELERTVGRPSIYRHTGLRSEFNYTGPKAAWLRVHEPSLFRRARWLLQPKDNLHLRLTDVAATDPTSASRTLLFDIDQEDWWQDGLDTWQIPRRLLPPISPSGSSVAGLTRRSASMLGIASGTPVALGAADRPAEALGLGIEGSVAMVSTGTASGVALAIDRARRPVDDRIPTPRHAVGDELIALLSIPTSGAILEWLAKLAGQPRDLTRLLRAAARRTDRAASVLAILSFSGARSFRWDNAMRGALLGIELGTDLVDLVRAVVESIALEVAACLDVLRASVGPIDRLRLTGGGYAPPYPAQVTADFTGLPATRYADRDAALSGAMLLAGQAIGAWGDARQAAADRLGAGRTFTPVPGSPIRQADLRVRYERAVEAIRIFSHSSVERGDSRIEDGVPTRA